MEKILIIDDEAFIRENVARILCEDGYEAHQAANGAEALEQLSAGDVDLALLDLNLGSEHGIDVLKALKEADPELLVIIITGYGSVESAVEALKLGAYHYMKKPFKADALRVIVKLALQTQTLKREVRSLKRADADLSGAAPLLGRSPAFQEVVRQVREVAPIATTVLITGESGTGKELVARAIHNLSSRRESPFIAINCASIPSTLLESELFGHEKGAFTNANTRKPGLFEEAHHGTIFLDEIGEMELSMQAKLLRVLQERSIRRVGGVKDLHVDVRVVAATNKDLPQRIAGGSFREDLYYRLNVFPINIPPLRQRPEDIAALASLFLEQFSKAFSKDFHDISPAALSLMSSYPWPGNVRELRNIIERICIRHQGPILLPDHLPHEISGDARHDTSPHLGHDCFDFDAFTSLEEAVAALESALIRRALQKTADNVQQAASLLGIPRGTLRYKMEKYGM